MMQKPRWNSTFTEKTRWCWGAAVRSRGGNALSSIRRFVGDASVPNCTVRSRIIELRATKEMRRHRAALSMLWSPRSSGASKINASVPTGAKQAMHGILQKQPENPLQRPRTVLAPLGRAGLTIGRIQNLYQGWMKSVTSMRLQNKRQARKPLESLGSGDVEIQVQSFSPPGKGQQRRTTKREAAVDLNAAPRASS